MPSGRAGFGLQADGTLWAWGNSIMSGTNSATASVSSPIQVVGAHRFITVESSYEHSLALKDNGQCWSWGINSWGNLGIGTYSVGVSSPVQVVGAHSFLQIYSGYQCAAAIKNDGQVWTWGRNNYGQLGNNSATQSFNSPVQVVGSHSFTRVMGGSELFFGLKSNSIPWGWGRNEFGQLGDNTVTNRTSPVQVIGNHSFVQLRTSGYHTLALKRDGSAWAWGVNSWGCLGTNNVINYSSPVQVVGSHSFTSILAEYHGFSAAMKENGQIWGWGCNSYGQLGNNTFNTSYSSPVQVVGAHSFIAISSCANSIRGLKASGQIWGWGWNGDARAGGISQVSYNSPVQILGGISYTKLLSGISIPVSISGVWRKRPTVFVNIGGTWMKVQDLWIIKSGNWDSTDNLNK